MKFQEIDFHVELFKAFLEPKGARLQYLESVRKEIKYKRSAFLIKLKSALDVIQNSYYETYYRNKALILNDEREFELDLPINAFNRVPILKNFSQVFAFSQPVNQRTIEGLNYLVNALEGYYMQKEAIMTNSKDDLKVIQNKPNPLESIWLQNAKLSLIDFLDKGFDLGLWDKDYNLTAKRGGVYGSEKTLLANAYVSLKGNSINANIDHKKAGELFCEFFKIKIDPNTENPFKKFQSGDDKQIRELKKAFKINS